MSMHARQRQHLAQPAPSQQTCQAQRQVHARAAPTAAPKTSGWGAAGTDGVDRLHNLGRAQNYNINVDHGQSAEFIDTRFTGNILGRKSDLASGELRYTEFRTYNNIEGDYYIAQRFLHRVAMHIAKNYLCHAMPGIKVPLILGVWGPKGTGKTFQTELSFKKMKAQPVIMSAGELESGTAGGPGYLLRSRYRSAADMSKARGVLSCLVVNDIDAGLGRFEDTGATVNNQICCSTLMNICDTPERVSLGLSEVWGKKSGNKRIPIIVTGNDFSTLWAPLVRDGRMDKFYWEPNTEEKVHMVYQMYKEDDISFEEVQKMIERFGNQPLDFFGAIRASSVDNQILAWIRKEVTVTDLSAECNLSGIRERLLHNDDLPAFEPQDLTFDNLIEQGDRLVHEHEMINSLKLSDVYMNKGNPDGKAVTPMLGFAS